MRANWIDISMTAPGHPADLKSLHHLNIDNRVVAVLAYWRQAEGTQWLLYTPETYEGAWRDSSRIHLSDSRFETVKANNVEQAKLRAVNKLVLRWQDYALAGIRLLNREEGG